MTAVPGSSGAAGHSEIRIGISSWGDLPGFYPSGIKAGDKLTWYARFFGVVEVNVSYYRLVPPRTYDQWLDATPDKLIFDVKAFGELTHYRQAPPKETFAAFRSSYAPLRERERLGGVLFQFPPRFVNSPANRSYLATRRRGDEWRPGDRRVPELHVAGPGRRVRNLPLADGAWTRLRRRR